MSNQKHMYVGLFLLLASIVMLYARRSLINGEEMFALLNE